MLRILWPTSASRLVLWVAFSFLVGVAVHAAFPFVVVHAPLWIGAFITWGAILCFPGGLSRRAILLCMAAGIFGLWRFDVTIPRDTPEPEFSGRVVVERRYDVLVQDERTRVQVAISGRRRVGERVRVVCGRIEPISQDAKSAFDARQGAWFTCKGSVKVSTVVQASLSDPRRQLQAWRGFLTSRIQSILPGDQGALLAGILYGERGLSTEASNVFKSAGMTHLIAVSGSNIALVASLFVPGFLALGYRRKASIVLAGGAIFLFVLFVGAQASVVRAAVMGWLALLARVFGRKATAARLLIIAACCIVIFDPWALAFDAGFALSFLATWGLLSWSRPIANNLKWLPEPFSIREAASTTLAATLVTFPYSLWAFGQTSFVGLLTNVIAIPLVGMAMLWGTVALVAGTLVPATALPASGFLGAILLIARLSEIAPWARVTWTLPTWALFSCYAMLVLLAGRRVRTIESDPPLVSTRW